MSVGEIAGLISGTVVGGDPAFAERQVSGKVEFDSRRVQPGDLFLAFVGARVDGHDFVQDARAAGAVAVLATRPVPGPSIQVADPIAAITALATAQARRLSARIVAVTGSSGKTSTKDLIAQVLSRHGRTVAPPGSFNNELGFPYTVLLADAGTEYLVLEASARGLGHITHLTEIAPPHVGVVLNVGTAHLGEFGSVAAIAQTKGELVQALPPKAAGGVAVLNADDPVVLAMAGRTAAGLLTFGEHGNADVRAADIRLDDTGRARFDLIHRADRAPVALALFGEHQVANALAAAAVGLACELPLGEVADALSAATSRSRWRMEVTRTRGGVVVINDAYNANPESMRAALKSLAIMSRQRRSVAVLGHMAELGEASTSEHDALGRLIVRLDIGHVIAVGPQARAVANGAALEGSWNGESEWVPDVEAAIQRLAETLTAGDVVLVKGSRAAAMERVAEAVIAAQGGAAGQPPDSESGEPA
jgi:UDP-N-acetylmuramoyl-tripeptide--D-alanyl-D-alanine ligase